MNKGHIGIANEFQSPQLTGAATKDFRSVTQPELFQSPQLTGAATPKLTLETDAMVRFQSPQLTGAATRLSAKPAR